MHVLNFPVPYTEELVYSTVARAGVRQGLTSPKQLLDDVFDSRSIIATIDLPNHLGALTRWLPSESTPETLIYGHTLFPLYAPFVTEARRLRCIKWLKSGVEGSVHLTLGVAASRIKNPRFLRYCPSCLATQRERYGEYFWLREWQVAGVEACLEHGVLIDTRIARPLIERHRFIAASPGYCPLVRQRMGSEVANWITAQVRQLLTLPAQASPSFSQWTDYYRNLARRNGYCRGKVQIDHIAIREEVLRVWPNRWLTRNCLMPFSSGVYESDWLKSIFRKHRKSFNFLEHIVVLRALLGRNWQIADVLKEVRQYPVLKKSLQAQAVSKNTFSQTSDQKDWLALLSCHHPKQARKTSPALYARLYRNHHDWLLNINHRHADACLAVRNPRVNWEERDREFLQTLRQLATFLKVNQQGPRRSRAYYLKLLGNLSTLEKNLYLMPYSSSFLTANTESVAQYQIRRLQTTFDDLRSLFDLPPRWRLLRNANLSEERLTKQARIYLENLVDREHEVQRFRK